MENIYLTNEIQDHINLITSLQEVLVPRIVEFSDIVLSAIKNGNKVILFGNGGSAADAQHISAEFTGRFVREREGLAAISLTTDTSALTAIGNDYGFEFIFSRQVEAIAKEGDVVIGISTSGNSKNVLNALLKARDLKCITASFTGRDGGEILTNSDFNINISHNVTARIQEMHILVGHLICSYVDYKYSN